MATTAVQQQPFSLSEDISWTPRCVPVLLSTVHPFQRTLSLHLSQTTTIADILDLLTCKYNLAASASELLRIHTLSGHHLSPCTRLHSLITHNEAHQFISLQVQVSLRGGKGGFGSMLRAQGGKMSANKRNAEENTDSCRDLNGRRLATVKSAQEMSKHIADQSLREAQEKKVKEEKYRRLEKMLGRDKKQSEEESSAVVVGKRKERPQEEDAEEGDKVIARSGDHTQTTNTSTDTDAKPVSASASTSAPVSNAKSAVAIAMAKKKLKQQQQQQKSKLSQVNNNNNSRDGKPAAATAVLTTG
ncbi:unnamed protein product [Sympodiomycopsis kandeliae]